MTYLNILSFVLLLLLVTSGDNHFQNESGLTSGANRFQNESGVSLNRTRRLSDGVLTEQTLELARYMVSLRTRRAIHNFYGENHFCCGVIIAPRYVLTSSHCCLSRRTRLPYPPDILLVVAGAPDRLKYQSGITFHSEVKSIFVPDNFTLHNEQDIGVLYLMESFPRHCNRIKIAKLPYRPLQVGTMCTVTGWGRMYKDGPMSAKILQIDIRVISHNKCSEMLGIEKKDLLCALDESAHTAQQPCDGDRGAPLMHGDTIYGIVSFLEECQAFDSPSVYTDVFLNIGWIRSVMMENSNAFRVSLSLLLFYGAVALNFLLNS